MNEPNNKNRVVIFYCFLLCLLQIPTLTNAHGGIDDGDSATPTDAPSTHSGSLAQGNIGLGFGLTAIAAVACVIGSLAPFLDDLFPLLPFLKDFRITQSKGFLAGSLSLAAGILLNLALGDLFPEAVSDFSTSNLFPAKWSRMVATAIFVVTITLLIITKKIFGKHAHIHQHSDSNDNVTKENLTNINNNEKVDHQSHQTSTVQDSQDLEAKRLKTLGIQIAIALTIHNFPEGLATFATTIVSSDIGILFGIALALHKFPEGLIVALPIYYATESRWKAFMIAATAGAISQMLGALFGYIVFVTYWNDAVPGFLFSIVSGVLLYTVLHSMLPMARHYDPEDRYCTIWVFVGVFFFGIVNSIFDVSGADA
ncbi:8791_t:CDS:2 [Ambispora leptoticha]|uniref:8791_t:CDS:1 n=1 Tax=Ambispora leptoticha TaxID=144679 RepID=A0A9N8VIR2_9GLOM|nr:8791_t:CDS:2 [Ambispora leptoticha]